MNRIFTPKLSSGPIRSAVQKAMSSASGEPKVLTRATGRPISVRVWGWRAHITGGRTRSERVCADPGLARRPLSAIRWAAVWRRQLQGLRVFRPRHSMPPACQAIPLPACRWRIQIWSKTQASRAIF